MIPLSVSHLGHLYDLKHLQPRSLQFDWVTAELATHCYRAKIFISNHCISEERPTPIGMDEAKFSHPTRPDRVFSAERYHHSLLLPDIMDRLFHKPTTQVILTVERNWYTFQLSSIGSATQGRNYYVFMRPKNFRPNPADLSFHHFDLSIESAYCRDDPPQRPHHNEKTMFGKLIERLSRSTKS